MEEDIIKELNDDLDLIIEILNNENEKKENNKKKEIDTKNFFLQKLNMEYIIIILTKIYSLTNNEKNNENIYKLLDKIFKILLKKLENKKDKINEKIASIIYFFSIIQNKLKINIPEYFLINIINFFSKIEDDKLLIKGLLILINKNNISSENISKTFPLISQTIKIFNNLNQDLIEYFIFHCVSIYITFQSSEFSKLLKILFNNYKNEKTILSYILYFQDYALKNENSILYYKFIKIILKSECFLKINISNDDESKKIENRFFTIIALNENDEKIQSITIRALDELFLKKKIIGYGKRLLNEREKEFLFISKFFNFFNNVKMTPLALRSFLLCIFKSENIINQLKYVKYGIDKFKIQYINLHKNLDIIENILKILERIYQENDLFLEYKNFLFGFCYCIIEISNKNISHNKDEFIFSIFSSYKILGNIFEQIIMFSIKNKNFNFRLEELCDIIDRSLFSFRKAFYYQLIINLVKKLIDLTNNDEISILTAYIHSLIKCILEKIRFDLLKTFDQSLLFNYYINVKNAIYTIIKILEYISFKSNKKFGEIIMDIFLTFINEHIENYILYIRDIFQDNKSIPERILDTFILYYLQIEKGIENSEIIKKYFYRDNECLFSILDFKKTFKIKELIKREKILEREGEVNKNTFFLSFRVICKILSINLNSIKNKDFKDLLEKMINDIIKGININKREILKNKFLVGDFECDNFKNKIVQRISEKKEIDIEFIKQNLINEKIIYNEKKEKENELFTNQSSDSEFKEDKTDYSTILNKINQDNTNIEFWYDDIKVFGLLSVHKTKNYLLKRLFSIMYLNEFFLNKNLDKLEELFKEKTKNSKKELIIKRFHEAKKIKNYITNNYTKPFLKLYRKFYTEKTYEISHSYAKEFKKEDNNKLKIPLKYNEPLFKIYCELLIPEGSIFSSILLFNNFIIIKSEKEIKLKPRTSQNMFSSIKYINKEKFIIIPFEYIFEIITRRFLYIWQACEIFTKDNKSYLINFLDKTNLLNFQDLLNKLKGENNFKIIQNSVENFKLSKIYEKWKNSKISNFDFLNLLNKYSSRSYNDLDQYPIFPWIFDSYEQLNEKNNKLRLFEYPISAQSKEKREYILDNYLMKKETEEFVSHHQIHYSTSAFVFYYLLRLSPITESHIIFQGNNFDNPDRMFHVLCDVKNLLEKYNDNRELIPEIFYFDEMYYNINLVYFGMKSSNKEVVHNVFLPKNCFNSSHFIYIQRMNLESNDIKNSISKWIDNIFGYNQYNKLNLQDSFNIFNWQCYENIFKIKYSKGEINENNLNDILTFINSFGQCPAILFNKKIDKNDFENDEEKILTYENISNKIKNSNEKNDKNSLLTKKLNNIDEKTEILILKYSESKIIILDNKHHISIYNKSNFEFIIKYNISKSYSYISKNSFIEFDNSNIIINSNYFDETIEIFSNIEVKSIPVNNLISCLCKINENSFYAGTVDGIIIKYQFNKNNKIDIEKLNEGFICHNNAVIWKIIYNENLNSIISIGGDHFIFIRNAFSFELINVIQLEFNEQNNIYLNEFNYIYVINIIKNTIDVFTLNGMKICETKEEINENYLSFPFNNKLYFFEEKKKILNEICPVYLQKNNFEIPINLDKINNSKINFFKFDENEKCFDFWTDDKIIYRLYLSSNRVVINNRKHSNVSQDNGTNKMEESWFNFSFFWNN